MSKVYQIPFLSRRHLRYRSISSRCGRSIKIQRPGEKKKLVEHHVGFHKGDLWFRSSVGWLLITNNNAVWKASCPKIHGNRRIKKHRKAQPSFILVQLEREKSHPFPKSQRNGRLKYQTEAWSTKKWVSPVVQVEPSQQRTSASRDSRSSSCSNHSSEPVEASSYEYPVPVVRRQQIGIEEELFSRGMSPTSHYPPFRSPASDPLLERPH